MKKKHKDNIDIDELELKEKIYSKAKLVLSNFSQWEWTSSLVKKYMNKKFCEMEKIHNNHSIEYQTEILLDMLSKCKNTKFGIKYKFKEILEKYKQGKELYLLFKNYVPIFTYDEFKPYILEAQKERNIFRPGKIKYFAKSSWTTSDQSKYIPVTPESNSYWRKSAFLSVCSYSHHNKKNNFNEWFGITLWWNLQEENKYFKAWDVSFGLQYGPMKKSFMDISSKFLQWIVQLPNKEINTIKEWQKKKEKMAQILSQPEVAVKITNISGVPTWVVDLLDYITQKKKVKYITDIWPNLELYIHWWVSFVDHKEKFLKFIKPWHKMHFVETYNASEWFFAIQNNLKKDDMLLLIDKWIFYEFIPYDKKNKEFDKTKIIDLKDVKKWVLYSVVITTNAWLWRYQLGDTIKFTNIKTHKIKIEWRTKSFINMYWEELMINNVESAFAKIKKNFKWLNAEFIAWPEFDKENIWKWYHKWFIEYEWEIEKDNFVKEFDDLLKKSNSDYKTKRNSNILLEPEINFIKSWTLKEFIKHKKWWWWQYKLIKLTNHNKLINEIKSFLNNNKEYIIN